MVDPVIIEEDQSGGYVVVCPSFEGCHSEGKTVEEALASIREAIELCLAELSAEGWGLPTPSGLLVGTVTV